MHIAPCRTYHAQTVGQGLLRMPDGKSVFKVYYISVIGRDKPELYEWRCCLHRRAEFEKVFTEASHEGIGFVIAFPHVAKIYRFSPDGETNLDVQEFNTEAMAPRDCSRSDGYHELACYAEAVLAADEFRAWASATTVRGYLAFRSDGVDFPVVSDTKLATYWNGP